MELNKKTIKKLLLLVFVSSIIIYGVFHMASFFGFLSKLVSFVSPIIVAFCIAFVFNVLLSALENRAFGFMAKSKKAFIQKMRRPLCLVLTYVLAFGIITLLVLVIIPDIADTVMYLVKNLPSFLESAHEWTVNLAQNFGIPKEKVPALVLDFEALTSTLQELFSGYSNKIVDGAFNITSSVVSGVYTAVFSIIISVYILAQKERIGRFTKRVIDTFLPQKTAYTIYYLSVRTSECFSRFISGQFTEAIILGLLCYIGMLIFRFPSAAIISVLIAITSLVPVVGAFIGISVGFLLILISNPVKALLFVVFVLILQQIEGNLIYPRVVGKAVGLPAVIVISAVLVGGNVGGILGSLLGVPISALVYTLLKEATEKPELKKKK